MENIKIVSNNYIKINLKTMHISIGIINLHFDKHTHVVLKKKYIPHYGGTWGLILFDVLSNAMSWIWILHFNNFL
jgi:hypothetical protein